MNHKQKLGYMALGAGILTFLIPLFVVCLIGCSETPEEVIVKEDPLPPLPPEVIAHLDQAVPEKSLERQSEDFGQGVRGEWLYHIRGKETPYTGWVKTANSLYYMEAGKKHGLFYKWNGDQKKSEGAYKENWKDGLWTEWYSNGRKRFEGAYRKPPNNTIDIYRSGSLGPSDSLGAWAWDRENREHIRVGVWTFWYENGNKAATGGYRDGGGLINVKDGLWTYWYENGNKKSVGELDAKDTQAVFNAGYGVDMGSFDKNVDPYETPLTAKKNVWTFWYEEGTKESQGLFLPSWGRYKKNSLWTYWYKNGQKAREGKYRLNEKDGPWTYWYPNGQKKQEGAFNLDKQVGRWTFWDEDGQITLVRDFGGD